MTSLDPSSPSASMSDPPGGAAPPRLSGGLPWLGHLLELRRRPIELMQRVRDECGEIGLMRWAGERVALVCGVYA